MGKKRKTREQKVRSSKRIEDSMSFKIRDGWIAKTGKSSNLVVIEAGSGHKFLKADLTKTLFLTMLVLAVELALWQILSRQ